MVSLEPVKYYDGHESVYQKIEQTGKTSWAERTGGEGMACDDQTMRLLLDEVFTKITFAGPTPYALDLGCGTGPFSAYLVERGFRTYGIDVSATAIKIAQRLAAEKGQTESQFAVADIVNYPNPEPAFDLIVDARCLHCLVFDEDRAKALVNIRQLLKPDGYFVIGTKTTGAEEANDKIFTDETGILWVKTATKIFTESKQIDGAWYMPQRRVLPPDALTRELANAGFAVTWSKSDGGLFSAISRRMD
jgi:SAM-dependent methyltransferase